MTHHSGLAALAAALVLIVWTAGRTDSAAIAAGRAPQRSSTESARRGLILVDSLLAAGLDREAAASATDLHDRFGDDPLYGWQLGGRLGLALLRCDRTADALPHLEAVARRDANEAVHHRNLGVALVRMGRRGRALAEFAFAVELDPGDADARIEYGQLLILYRDYAAARTQLETARRLCEGCLAADEALAALHMAAGDLSAAIAPLERLVAGGGGDTVRRNLLIALDAVGADGRLLERLRERPAADWSADEWRLAVEAEGRGAGTGEWSRAAVSTLDGAADVNRLERPPADDALFWGRVSLNLLNLEDYAGGLTAVDQALRLDPSSAVHHTNRAVLLQRLGREDDARTALEHARHLDPATGRTGNESP